MCNSGNKCASSPNSVETPFWKASFIRTQMLWQSSMARLCECVFGTAAPGESQYMIRCNDTYKSKRAFELWMSTGCSDCHYSHNIENCQSCIFCFNVKNLRYAIGNVEVGREKFLEAKKILLSRIGKELESKGSLALDIYNLADFG